MKTLINIDQWDRKAQYLFFSKFEEPFWGVTVNIDCTNAYRLAKASDTSFFLYYLYRALKAANEIENFRYRIEDGEVYLFEQINVSSTVDRPNGTFGFCYTDFYEDEGVFYEKALDQITMVRQSEGLLPSPNGDNVIHFSALPWLDFTSLSHARGFSFPDSCPKISFGKMTEADGVKTMPIAVHVHHGLADGRHVGLFVEKFQALMR